MDSRAVMIVAAAAVAAASLAGGSAAASTGAVAASPGSHVWHTAIEVPGTAALNRGGFDGIASVSCAAAGNCSAGGFYTDRSGFQAFVVSQVNGAWHKAIEVPGTAALNRGGAAFIKAVSCGAAGNCSAGGFYTDSTGLHEQAFVVSQVNGAWHKAIEVPGTAALNRGGAAEIKAVSCASAGNCSAVGDYISSSAAGVFVVSQVNGAWHKAIEVPGTAALNRGGNAFINSVSCASAGNCSAGGFYADGPSTFQAFVVSQVNGGWHKAIEVPGTAALNTGGDAEINSVSCAAAGDCSAGGTYTRRVNLEQAFVVSQAHGTWQKAQKMPGTAALTPGGLVEIDSVSCSAAGNCSAGGRFTDSSGNLQVFVVSQAHGAWHKAIEVPGIAALNRGGNAALNSVSCGSAGNCSAGGSYAPSLNIQAFVVSQSHGTWHKAIEVPGIAALNRGKSADITSVSCAAAGNCSAGGTYTDGSGHTQVFVVSQT